MRIISIAAMLFLCILVISCSPEPDVIETDESQQEIVVEEKVVDTGDVVEGEYVEVRVREEDEPVTTKDPFDIIAQAQAAKDSGQNVNIQIS